LVFFRIRFNYFPGFSTYIESLLRRPQDPAGTLVCFVRYEHTEKYLILPSAFSRSFDGLWNADPSIPSIFLFAQKELRDKRDLRQKRRRQPCRQAGTTAISASFLGGAL
jgi:hypothetical protein